MTPLLSVKDVSKVYSSHTALDHISLDVPQGSIYGLLGPNGAGKTSLIRIINQITGPDTGEILFNGQRLHPDHTSQIGYMPEERGLYKKMEVGEQAIYLARLKGLSHEEALKRLKIWFERLDLKPWWRKKIEELSKGMQQKVQFIVTVLHEPPLLILDEPFTGFDPINANLIKDELLELSRKGTTIVLSTHRMESVEELCTHIALLNKSKKLLEGTVRSIRKEYRSREYEIEYSSANAGTEQIWSSLELLEQHVHDDHIVKRIRLNNSQTPNEVLQHLLPSITLHGFREILPSMNDIFISTVTKAGQSHE